MTKNKIEPTVFELGKYIEPQTVKRAETITNYVCANCKETISLEFQHCVKCRVKLFPF